MAAQIGLDALLQLQDDASFYKARTRSLERALEAERVIGHDSGKSWIAVAREQYEDLLADEDKRGARGQRYIFIKSLLGYLDNMEPLTKALDELPADYGITGHDARYMSDGALSRPSIEKKLGHEIGAPVNAPFYQSGLEIGHDARIRPPTNPPSYERKFAPRTAQDTKESVAPIIFGDMSGLPEPAYKRKWSK